MNNGWCVGGVLAPGVGGLSPGVEQEQFPLGHRGCPGLPWSVKTYAELVGSVIRSGARQCESVPTV